MGMRCDGSRPTRFGGGSSSFASPRCQRLLRLPQWRRADGSRRSGGPSSSRRRHGAPLFREAPDLERRRRLAAHLAHEEIEESLYAIEKLAQLRLGADIGGMARLEGGAVISQAEDTMPRGEKCTRQPPLLREGDPLRRQSDPVEQVKPR